MEQINTPYFEIVEEQLKYNVGILDGAIQKYWKNTVVGYSFKTNSLVSVCNYMKNQGYYAEVVSSDEYELAKQLGYSIEHIIYNGPCKTKETLFEILDHKGIVNLDAKREVDWAIEYARKHQKCEVGLRANFNLEKMCPNETAMGEQGSRFGFAYENGDLAKTIDLLNQNDVKVVGLHLHNSSKTRSIKVYDVLSKMACIIAKELNLELKYVDIGGGFFGGVKGYRNFYDYFEVISHNLLSTFSKNLMLIVEPGASVIASAINYVTTVIDVKDNYMGNRIVLTDGSRIHIDPLMQKSKYDWSVNGTNNTFKDKQFVCGFTCMEHDIIMEISNSEEFEVGNQIKYNKVGSYSITLSPLFIQYFPTVYFLRSNGEKIVIREKWNARDIMQKQRVIE